MALKFIVDPGCPISEPIKAPAYEGDVGYDLGVAISEERLILNAYNFTDLPTFVRLELPKGTWGDIRPRSSTYARRHLIVMQATIDNGYRGLISVFVFNPNPVPVTIHQGDYLAQLVLCPIMTPVLQKVDGIGPSLRGNKGFGSSGGFKVSLPPAHTYQKPPENYAFGPTDTPIYCEHANECPSVCPCSSECWCRRPGRMCSNVATWRG